MCRVMREVGKTLGIPVNVFGNETHMTAIVSMALGKRPIPKEPTVESHTANFLLPGGQNTAVSHCFTFGQCCLREMCYFKSVVLV